MAAHLRHDILYGRDHVDTHASANRWRHQESRSFARHASGPPREADAIQSSKDLAAFLNDSRVEPPRSSGSGAADKHRPIMVAGNAHNGSASSQTLGTHHGEGMTISELGRGRSATLEVKCGPLLNYRRMENQSWYGSVLIVTKGGGLNGNQGGGLVPELTLRSINATHATGLKESDINANSSNEVKVGAPEVENEVGFADGRSLRSTSQVPSNGKQINGNTAVVTGSEDLKVRGTKLYSDPSNTFWRFNLRIPMQQSQLKCDYSISGLNFPHGKKTDKQCFFIPAISESMRIMFHSCNGFSVGTDEDAWSGPALWNDVLRVHKKTPFHVMLGGGDQIYNDGIRVNGPLRRWTDIGNPRKRRDFPFPEILRKECDEYYVENYIRWYGTESFASANGQIAQLNLWDDHDIIDGFGSYVDDFMRCAVFRGIGGVAHKYYLLFQHHLAPPASTFTTDAPQTMSGPGFDPRQSEDTYVLEEKTIDSSYIIGPKPGPYVAERSRSIYARLGARIAFFGIDARTERTRKQVNYPETYNTIFSRLRKELSAAASTSSPIQHLIVLLGIPIAYPRLTWLENIFSSPIMGPMKFLNKRFGFGGGFFNHFDGSVDLLDDLDDHYTARTHKRERHYLVLQLQALASEFSVRISILGGDVHLAAVGRFYSNPQLNIPIIADHRYMANIISSAIVNKPPPQAVANLLARRNKLHHFDDDTDETLLNFFDKDPRAESKASNWNHVTMPSRNWAMITENSRTNAVVQPVSNDSPAIIHAVAGADEGLDRPLNSIPKAKNGHSWLHDGEVGAGTNHKAADSQRHGKDVDGSLDVCIRVEMDQHDKEGKTQGYGMSIPRLVYEGDRQKSPDLLRDPDADNE